MAIDSLRNETLAPDADVVVDVDPQGRLGEAKRGPRVCGAAPPTTGPLPRGEADIHAPEQPSARPAVRTTAGAIGQDLPLDQIVPSPLNPRKHFAEGPLADLAASVREHGILEPIVVRRVALGRYEIVAGERRYRAAQLAGLVKVPCRIIMQLSDADHLKLALIENLQRQDLDPIEEAEGYARLNREAGMRQAAIAAAVNRAQPTIANRMRLLELPEDVQNAIRQGKLTPAHGIALARFAAFPVIVSKLAGMAIANDWKTKDLEQPLPAAHHLTDEGLIVSLVNAQFDTEACRSACPFNAYRQAQSWHAGYCLKPEHAEQLTLEARSERERRAHELAAQSRVATDDADIPTGADAPKPLPLALPMLRDLRSNQYETIRSENVDGCAAGICPCRGKAIDYDDTTVVEICTDPIGRRMKLRSAQTRARNKAARAEYKALAERLTARLEDLTEIGPAELAILAGKTIEHGTWRSSKALDPAIKRWLPEAAPDGKDRSGYRPKIAQLAHLDTLAVVRLAVAVLLETELAIAVEQGAGSDVALTRWYLGALPATDPGALVNVLSTDADDLQDDDDTIDPAVSTFQEADAEAENDDYPRESDLHCERCGEPVVVTSAEHDRRLAEDFDSLPWGGGAAEGPQGMRPAGPFGPFCANCAPVPETEDGAL